MKKVVIISFLLLYTGCSFKVTSSGIEQIELTEEVKPKKFPCEKKAKAKSLQFLEQQYRCTSHKKIEE
jgi:hypothetical protein